MRRVWSVTRLSATVSLLAVGAFFLTAVNSAPAAAKSAGGRVNQDAFVYILNIGIQADSGHTFTYKGSRNGFAVGDGRYVLTAAHCIDDFENTDQTLTQPLVLSPYYGDVFEARIVAVDKDNDIAILKPAWDIHPALALASPEQCRTSPTITIAGYPPLSEERGGDGEHCSRRIRCETVPQVSAAHAPMSIGAGPVKYAGPGWSGSALIVPETGSAAGITCVKSPAERSANIFGFKLPLPKKHYIFGCDAAAIRNLFAQSDLPLNESPPPFPDGSRRAHFEMILSVLDTLKPENADRIASAFEELGRQMPEGYLARVVQALMSERSDVEVNFEKAAQMAPESTLMRAGYGNLLSVYNKPQEAAVQFQRVIEQDPNHMFAYHGRLAALVKADPNAAESLGAELIRRWPQRAGFWFEYSRALRANNKRRQELPIIQKAVELSETVPHLYQRHLADSLSANKNNEEARQAYEELLRTHQCENCWLAYASHLLEMGPDARPRAQEAVAKARSFNKDPNSLADRYSVVEEALDKMLADPNTPPENQPTAAAPAL